MLNLITHHLTATVFIVAVPVLMAFRRIRPSIAGVVFVAAIFGGLIFLEMPSQPENFIVRVPVVTLLTGLLGVGLTPFIDDELSASRKADTPRDATNRGEP